MREDFKQHVNVIALQAVRGTWQVSPANYPSPLLSMGRPGFLNSPAKHTKIPLPPASSQTRSAQGASGEFSGWSNVGGQATIGIPMFPILPDVGICCMLADVGIC